MTARTHVLLVVLLSFTCPVLAQAPIPAALRDAKTVYLINAGADLPVLDDLAKQLQTWGRWTLVDDAKQADLYITMGGFKGWHGWTWTITTPDGIPVWSETSKRHLHETVAVPLVKKVREWLEGKDPR